MLLEKMPEEVAAAMRGVKVENYLRGRRNSRYLLKVEHTQMGGGQEVLENRVQLDYKYHRTHTNTSCLEHWGR